jgi:hypothetical protein
MFASCRTGKDANEKGCGISPGFYEFQIGVHRFLAMDRIATQRARDCKREQPEMLFRDRNTDEISDDWPSKEGLIAVGL